MGVLSASAAKTEVSPGHVLGLSSPLYPQGWEHWHAQSISVEGISETEFFLSFFLFYGCTGSSLQGLRAFSGFEEQGLPLTVALGPLIALLLLGAHARASGGAACGLGRCGLDALEPADFRRGSSQVELLSGRRNLPGPVFPTLAGGFLPPGPPGKSWTGFFTSTDLLSLQLPRFEIFCCCFQILSI